MVGAAACTVRRAAEWKLRRHQILQRAKKKLRAVSVMVRVYRAKRMRRSVKRVIKMRRLSHAGVVAVAPKSGSAHGDEDGEQQMVPLNA